MYVPFCLFFSCHPHHTNPKKRNFYLKKRKYSKNTVQFVQFKDKYFFALPLYLKLELFHLNKKREEEAPSSLMMVVMISTLTLHNISTLKRGDGNTWFYKFTGKRWKEHYRTCQKCEKFSTQTFSSLSLYPAC